MTNDNTLQWLGANILLPDGRELPAGERLHFQGGLTIGYQGVEQKQKKSHQHFDFLFISLSLKGIKSFNIVSSGSPPRAHNLCARLHDGAGKALEEGRSASSSCLHRLRRPRCPRPDSFSCPCQVGKQFKHWLKTNRLQRF